MIKSMDIIKYDKVGANSIEEKTIYEYKYSYLSPNYHKIKLMYQKKVCKMFNTFLLQSIIYTVYTKCFKITVAFKL